MSSFYCCTTTFTHNYVSMIRRLVVMLDVILWAFWFISISYGGNDETQDSPPEDQSRLKSASAIIALASQRVQDSPKQFKDHFQEKVAQAEKEPWRETADEILLIQAKSCGTAICGLSRAPRNGWTSDLRIACDMRA